MSRLGYQINQEDYDRLRPVLVGKAKHFSIPADDIEDLIQETLWQVQEALDKGQFKGESAFDTWVLGIAKRRFLRYHRSKRAAKRNAEEVPLDDPDAPAAKVTADQPQADTMAADRQLLSRVLRDINCLSEKLRQPLLLVASGQSYREVAEALDISINLVTSRTQQARAILRSRHLRSS